MSKNGVDANLFEFLLKLGDDALISGHRLSEWCGHGPILEEDIALANMALDCVGAANSILNLAAAREGRGRSADDLAYLRNVVEFRNALLVELPKGDFARTILRQYLFAAYELEVYSALSRSSDQEISGIAGRIVKERRYHVRHCGEWVLRLGLGTDESHLRLQRALDDLWGYTAELFDLDAADALAGGSQSVDVGEMHDAWGLTVRSMLAEANLQIPDGIHQHTGGRRGRHSEYLGHILDEMQILARSHPGADW